MCKFGKQFGNSATRKLTRSIWLMSAQVRQQQACGRPTSSDPVSGPRTFNLSHAGKVSGLTTGTR